jgi:hypothetical protein
MSQTLFGFGGIRTEFFTNENHVGFEWNVKIKLGSKSYFCFLTSSGIIKEDAWLL